MNESDAQQYLDDLLSQFQHWMDKNGRSTYLQQLASIASG
jgi:hypothetical protein